MHGIALMLISLGLSALATAIIVRLVCERQARTRITRHWITTIEGATSGGVALPIARPFGGLKIRDHALAQASGGRTGGRESRV